MTTFNFHLHLPHYRVTTDDTKSVRVLARQPIDLRVRTRSPPRANRVQLVHLDASRRNAGGHILMADSTIFTTLFGGTESLASFWRNVATM